MRRLSSHVALVAAAALAVAVAGCNIFGEEDPPTMGQDAPELREKLDRFLATGSTMKLTSTELFEIAKQNRRASGIGVLTMARQISNTESAFPFESMSQTLRVANMEPLSYSEKALGIILYANKYGSEAERAAMAGESPLETELQEASERAEITTGMDPCGFYADYVAAKIVRVTIDFRRRLETTIPGVAIVRASGGAGYKLDYSGTNMSNMSFAELQTLNSDLQSLFSWFGGELDGVINIIAGSSTLFDCDSVLLDDSTEESVLLSLTEMRGYINDALRNIDYGF